MGHWLKIGLLNEEIMIKSIVKVVLLLLLS